MVVKWDFMVTNVTKVGFVKIQLRIYLYARCLLRTHKINNNGSKCCDPTKTVNCN